MTSRLQTLIETLADSHTLTLDEYEELLNKRCDEAFFLLREKAVLAREQVYGRDVFLRGLVEISNICKNNCLYCGLRAENSALCRYRLTPDEIVETCRHGYALGLNTFVLQGGENDLYPTDAICDIIRRIKEACPNVAVTLSLGEKDRATLAAWRAAGADRYLLRHETATREHYEALHPSPLSFENRMRCLNDLKELGYQVGAGFLVGSPYQTNRHLARDLKFIEMFRPQMCGIGPFLPQKDTPFASEAAGDASLCLYLLCILRLIDPALLLPATTALSSSSEDGREAGILCGANVVMPCLTPSEYRDDYALYDNKKTTGAESAEELALLSARLTDIGYHASFARGDYAAR